MRSASIAKCCDKVQKSVHFAIRRQTDTPPNVESGSGRKVCNRISEFKGRATDYLSEQERTAASSQSGDVADEVDF